MRRRRSWRDYKPRGAEAILVPPGSEPVASGRCPRCGGHLLRQVNSEPGAGLIAYCLNCGTSPRRRDK